MTTRFPALRLLVFLLIGFFLPPISPLNWGLGAVLFASMGGSVVLTAFVFGLSKVVSSSSAPLDQHHVQSRAGFWRRLAGNLASKVWKSMGTTAPVRVSSRNLRGAAPIPPDAPYLTFLFFVWLGVSSGTLLRMTHSCLDGPMLELAQRSEVPSLIEGSILESLGSSELSDQFVAEVRIHSPSLPNHQCRVMLRVPKLASIPYLKPGVHFQVNAALRLPQKQLICTDWNERSYCRSHELLWIARAYPASLSLDYRSLDAFSLRGALRDWVMKTIARCFSPSSQSLAASVLFAETRSLDEDMVQSLQQSGIYHLFLSSTMHIVLAALCMNVFCAWIPWKIPRLLVFALGLCLPLMLSAWSPTPLRTALLLLCIQVLRVTQRSASRLNVLAFLCLAMIFIDPASLFHPGFQLSVCAILSYHLFYNRTSDFFHLVWPTRSRASNWLQRALSGSVATSLLLAPLIALHSSAYHFLSALVGMVLSVPGILCSVTVFLAVLLEPIWHSAASSVAALAQELMQLLWLSADELRALPSLQVFAPSAWIIGSCYSLCFVSLFVCKTRRAVLLLSFGGLITIACCVFVCADWQDDLQINRSHMTIRARRLHEGVEYLRFVADEKSVIVPQHDRALCTFFTMFDADTLIIDAREAKYRPLIESVRESLDEKTILEIQP